MNFPIKLWIFYLQLVPGGFGLTFFFPKKLKLALPKFLLLPKQSKLPKVLGGSLPLPRPARLCTRTRPLTICLIFHYFLPIFIFSSRFSCPFMTVISSNQLQPGSTSASIISNKPSTSTSKSNFSYQRSTTSSNNQRPPESYVNQFATRYREHLNKTISCVGIIYGLFGTKSTLTIVQHYSVFQIYCFSKTITFFLINEYTKNEIVYRNLPCGLRLSEIN